MGWDTDTVETHFIFSAKSAKNFQRYKNIELYKRKYVLYKYEWSQNLNKVWYYIYIPLQVSKRRTTGVVST